MRYTFFYILAIFFLFNSNIFPANAETNRITNSKLEDSLLSRVAFGQGKDVLHLLKEGANPDVRNAIGQPIIVLAAGRGDAEAVKIVKALTAAGADITVFDEQGNNALIAATRKGSLETLEHILTFLPAMKTLDGEGNNLVTIAERRDNYEILYAIEEAMKDEDERLSVLQGDKMLSKLMKDYSYYYCAHAYLEYYSKLDEAKEVDKEKLNGTLTNLYAKAEEVGFLLVNYFDYTGEMLSYMVDKSKTAIVRELKHYPDKNYRRVAGIGTDEDVNTRCDKVALRWKTRTEKIESDDDKDFETPWY